MATTNRVYILAAFIFSTIGAISNMVSLGTEEWITAKAIWINNNTNNDVNHVNYGLFQGSYVRHLARVSVYDLQMTCNFQINICAFLCGEDRYTLLTDLYNNNVDGNDAMDKCYKALKSAYSYNYGVQVEKKIGARSNKIQPESFINAGVWLCTLIFLISSASVGAIAAVLALYNTVSNPIQYYLGVKSLYVYNSVPFCCTVLYMVLWGTMYNMNIFHNVAIYDTLTGNLSSDKRAYLGYSYWISLVPLAFYTGSIGILFYREYLNEKDPKQQKVDLDADSADPNLYLY